MADYPISNVARRIVYTGSAGVGPYAFNFEVLTNTDIKVYKNDVLLTLTTDYTVSISSTLGTGSVTLVSAATGSDRITIVGARPVERTTDFTTGGDFFANTVNDELDSQTILVQQVAETAERSIKAPVTDPTNINMVLPINTVRAGKTLAFDASGNPVAGDPIGNWRGNWASGTTYANRDIVKDTTNDNIYLVTTAHTSSGSLPISTNADSAKWALVIDAAAAGEARIAAEAAQAAAELAETNAETAETNAETAETNAETAATNAASSASAASSSASAASSSASSASSSASAASTSATNAASSASAASTSASNASSSASSASSSASTATTQATNASNSASAASTSATNASNSASAASTSATNAASSASSASTSATNAASAQTAAEAARDQTLTAFDNFDDRYLGTKTSDPSVDNDGNALLGGALYFNSTDGVMKVYTGSAWVAAYASLSGALIANNNLSDLNSASIARDNLGVEIGVDVQAYDADLADLATNGAGTGNSQYVKRDSSAKVPIGSTWKVYESSGILYFEVSGTAKAKLDGSGNLTVVGNVTAYGTI
ncbi:hypothetical protein [Brevundimonas sp.]|jgi:hypothetical protein|uniref:hypothetical protein n=1 Tax=Brevundimonas sp. TaxID=1871086 RepID=UPI003782EDB8